MASYDSDEEQIEAIKRWWNENGTSLIISVVVILAVLFSWRQFKSSQEANAAAASELYQQIAEIGLIDNAGQQVSDEDFSTAQFLNDQLRNEHEGSVYARFSALFLARLYVERGDLDSAESELGWILDNPDLGLLQSAGDELTLTARLRLAKVVLAKGDAERALSLLQAVEPGEFAGSYAAVEGDVYMALEQPDQAREAYLRAYDLLDNAALVELKLRDLGVEP